MPQLAIAFAPQRFVERAGEPHHLLDVRAVAAAAQRIVRFVVEGNVEHRAEIEIEAEEPQQASGDLAVAPNECDVVLLAQLLRVRRLVADQPQPRNAAAFLVDRDDRLDVAEIAQIVDQLPQLRRARDVAAEKDEAAGLDAPEQRGRLCSRARCRERR